MPLLPIPRPQVLPSSGQQITPVLPSQTPSGQNVTPIQPSPDEAPLGEEVRPLRRRRPRPRPSLSPYGRRRGYQGYGPMGPDNPFAVGMGSNPSPRIPGYAYREGLGVPYRIHEGRFYIFTNNTQG
jgi:hypothetical protein